MTCLHVAHRHVPHTTNFPAVSPRRCHPKGTQLRSYADRQSPRTAVVGELLVRDYVSGRTIPSRLLSKLLRWLHFSVLRQHHKSALSRVFDTRVREARNTARTAHKNKHGAVLRLSPSPACHLYAVETKKQTTKKTPAPRWKAADTSKMRPGQLFSLKGANSKSNVGS